jgi:hypothetical protein
MRSHTCTFPVAEGGMNRRAFLTSAVVIATATHCASAQTVTKTFSIGWLTAQRASSLTPFLDVFRSGLAELGYREADNLEIEYRYGDDNLLRVAPLALNSRANQSNFWLYRALLFLSCTNSSCPYPPSTSLAEIPLSPGLLKVSLARGAT